MPGHAPIDADLILQHSGFIRSLARGLLRDESLVDDVVQETLIKALEKGPRHPGALTAWLRTVTRNIAYKSYRGTARRRAREEEAARPEHLTSTVDVVARGEALESLTAAVMELPEQAREVVFMRYYEGLSHAEIGERLGLASGAVRMRLHRAQKLLQDRLDRRSNGDRMVWMSGLAGLAGIGLKDIGRGVRPATALSSEMTVAAVAAGVVICAGLGWALWFGTGGGAAPEASLLVKTASLSAPEAEIDEAPLEVAPRAKPGRKAPEAAASSFALGDAAEPLSEPEPDDLVFPEGNLKGTVVDLAGRPVPGALIFAAWGRQAMGLRTETNARGRFGVEVPEPVLKQALDGEYFVLLAATAEDSAPTRVHAWPKEGLDDAHGGKHALLRMRGPGGTLEGVVRGLDGRPIVGAEIRLGERNRLGVGFLGQQSAVTENKLAPLLATYVERRGVPLFQGHRSMRGTLGAQALEADGTRSRLVPATTRESKADGTFRFGGLELGPQTIRITAPGYAPYHARVQVQADGPLRQVFELKSGSILRGTLTRSDGLAPTAGLVHAFHRNPYTVQTVKMAPDGSYELRDLPDGSVRIVAEERLPRDRHAPRLAATGLTLRPGEIRSLDLEMHEPLLAMVRILQVSQDGPIPAQDVSVELRALDNPLDVVSVHALDPEGRTTIPLETVRGVEWTITKKNSVYQTPSGEALRASTTADATPVRRMAPPSREAAVEEIVITLGEEDLATAPVLMEPTFPGAGPFDYRDGFALFRTDEPFTFVGWSTSEPGVLQFNGVPTGDYHVMYPHHGLGWISESTVHVGASASGAPLNLGRMELPALGSLALTLEDADSTQPSATRRWSDLDIKRLLARSDGRGDTEIAVFMGRVEIPTTVQMSPGRYVIRHPGHPDLPSQWLTIKSGGNVTKSWR